MRKRHRTLTVTRHNEDNLSKATSYLFPSKMIEKLYIADSNTALQNKEIKAKKTHKQWEQQ